MSRVRNKSGGPLDVPLLDRVVDAGEVAEVPDFQPAHTDDNPLPIIWPPDKWEPVPEPVVAPEPAKAATRAATPAPAPAPDPGPAAAAAPVPVSSDPRER